MRGPEEIPDALEQQPDTAPDPRNRPDGGENEQNHENQERLGLVHRAQEAGDHDGVLGQGNRDIAERFGRSVDEDARAGLEGVAGRRQGSAQDPGDERNGGRGEGLAAPIREAQIFPPFALHLLAVGEETGRLDDMLLQIAKSYDRDLRRSLKRLVALLEPAIIVVMGLIIGLMVVSLLYSIFSINDVPL